MIDSENPRDRRLRRGGDSAHFSKELNIMSRPRTLGALKAAGYRPRSVKDEIRENLIARLRSGEKLFPSIIGYEHTVEPQIVNALLSRQPKVMQAVADELDRRSKR